MRKSFAASVAPAVIAAVALSLGTVSADAKKKKKRHYYRSYQSEGYYPRTNAGHNQCMYDQTRYPALDIRCR
jgi:hypothetical protein